MLAYFCYSILGLIFYNLPSLIAIARLHNNAGKICLMNIVFGWTIVGWFIALYWALQPAKAEYDGWPYK